MYARQKMIIWQFSHIVQTVLVMAKWIIADCMTSSWLWVNLCCYPCKHEREILSRRFTCPPCLCRIPSRWKSVATIFDKLWQDGVPSTRSFFVASCQQLNIKSLGGNHIPCHICRSYWNVTQSFYRLKSWKIDISFSAVKHLAQQTPPSQKLTLQ